jgi:hypothetical protein
MGKIFVVIFSMFLCSCSGVEMRKKLFRHSVLVELEFAKSYAGVFEGELAVIEKSNYESLDEKVIIVGKFLDEINHSFGQSTLKRYIINVNGIEVGKEYISYIKLFDKEGDKKGIYYSNLLKFDKEHREIRFFIE